MGKIAGAFTSGEAVSEAVGLISANLDGPGEEKVHAMLAAIGDLDVEVLIAVVLELAVVSSSLLLMLEATTEGRVTARDFLQNLARDLGRDSPRRR